MSEKYVSNSRIGFVGALTLILITLKLLNKIDCSWWIVLSPLWISIAFGLFIFAIAILIAIFSK